DCASQRFGLSTVHEEAMATAVDQLWQTVSRQPHHGRARDHGLEIDLTPRVVEHRLHEQSAVAIELLQFFPRQVGAQSDARRWWDEGVAALIAHDGEGEVGSALAGDAKGLEQQRTALGPK